MTELRCVKRKGWKFYVAKALPISATDRTVSTLLLHYRALKVVDPRGVVRKDRQGLTGTP